MASISDGVNLIVGGAIGLIIILVLGAVGCGALSVFLAILGEG